MAFLEAQTAVARNLAEGNDGVNPLVIPGHNQGWGRAPPDIAGMLRRRLQTTSAQQSLQLLQGRAYIEAELALMLASGLPTAVTPILPVPFAWNGILSPAVPSSAAISRIQGGSPAIQLFANVQRLMQLQNLSGPFPPAIHPIASRNSVDLGLQGILQLQATRAYLLEQGTLPLQPPSAAVAAVAASHSTPFRASRNDEQLRIQQSARSEILLLAIDDDRGKLNDHQMFLRRQIEVFRATETDIQSHTRAKNKPIVLGQVGIRCRHCRHLAPGRRRKASTYFPSALIGIYQAAHNLSVEHLQGGACPVLPQDIREELIRLGERKPGGASMAGKLYWADAAMRVGLVDTDDGIRFAEDVVD